MPRLSGVDASVGCVRNSDRNRWNDTVVAVKEGRTTSHVRIDANETIVTAAIANDAKVDMAIAGCELWPGSGLDTERPLLGRLLNWHVTCSG